jgi:hypothetical protein
MQLGWTEDPCTVGPYYDDAKCRALDPICNVYSPQYNAAACEAEHSGWGPGGGLLILLGAGLIIGTGAYMALRSRKPSSRGRSRAWRRRH